MYVIIKGLIEYSSNTRVAIQQNTNTIILCILLLQFGGELIKFTSTLVIRTILSFELADIFLKYGSRLFFKRAKKTFYFHPHRQRRRKHDPLDPERHDYDN